MKALLIDSNQKSYSYLSDLDKVTAIQFPPFSEWMSQDAIMTTFIKNQIDFINDIDLFIIPYSVTENYLEFSGLRLAHHIRLSNLYFKKPILFIGNLEPVSVYKLSSLSDILSTKSVYCTTPSKTDIETFLTKPDFIELDSIDQYLYRVSISPPSNYESHHSIANELALLQWSEFLQFDHEIPEVKENIQTGLYFKYIKALNPIVENPIGEIDKIGGKSRILLIDDEAEKGWFQFYKEFLKPSTNIEFDFLSIDFKSLTQKEIISKANSKIEKFDPDVVLLDLRLCDKDFVTQPTTKPEDDFTGVQILKDIKQINKGIQVIITTASNKAWNYQTALKEGANGFIIKAEELNAAQAIEKLRSTIQLGVKNAKFLKKTANAFKKINHFVKESLSLKQAYKKSVEYNLDIAFNLLEAHYNTPKYINYSYLQLFLIAEELLKEETVFIEGDNCYVVYNEILFLVLKLKNGIDRRQGFDSAIRFNNGHHFEKGVGNYDRKYIDTNFKMSAVLLFKYGFTTSGQQGWTKIINTRNNKAAHPEIGLVTSDEYNNLISFLEFIFNDSNFQPVDIENALIEPTIEDKIQQLKHKFDIK